ncbi:citrate synthase [Desulfacinum hydrothermale DSM 13146]|uniref:Citrate synthase n=1 Tax=Desulfacinum hydrothermale DSM 13146 TaxID=1121390 RepID=A0A1W1XMD4_9BACT|nr:citrate synthase [Desulfacinum hydrothermale]SMC25160.1 citrate synthase [Desulfacinum hydrothermale DSM 13146]
MAEQTVRTKNVGLRGITVADTKISYIDGERGVLIYRGYRIEDLALRSTFPETAYLLLHEFLPSPEELQAFEAKLREFRALPGFVIEAMKAWPRGAHPMDALQASIPLLAMDDPDLGDESREANVTMALRLIARLPAVVGAWHRIRQGLDVLPPDDALSHAGNFLWQVLGKKPDEETARIMDVCLILHADHTFNASTFACREVVSTRAHMYAGVAAGVGALSGELHGGANARVMEMLQKIDRDGVTDIAAWVRDRLDRKERIMGMGHAVYKTLDPRARILKELAFQLGEKTGQTKWPEMTAAIEEAAMAELEKRGKKGIQPNVDFYSASVYHILGFPGDLMTCIFAVSRIAGWCAHIIEEKFAEAQGKPALYRPKAEYVGDYCGRMDCEYVPPEKRGRD